jgi:hypothetical protein
VVSTACYLWTGSTEGWMVHVSTPVCSSPCLGSLLFLTRPCLSSQHKTLFGVFAGSCTFKF